MVRSEEYILFKYFTRRKNLRGDFAIMKHGFRAAGVWEIKAKKSDSSSSLGLHHFNELSL